MARKQHDVPCYTQARDDEDLFVLRGQDVSSPRSVCFWILENIETAPKAKLTEALECALAMREDPNRKRAD